MEMYRFTLNIQSAFGTPLVGDTLFGQLCWAIRNQLGEAKLNELLQGYTEQRPFIVVSDAFPKGYLPLPILPSSYWQKGEETDRKKLKKKQWVALDTFSQAVEFWQQFAKAEKDLIKKQTADQFHNTLNRATQTTSTGIFAPYAMPQIWYDKGTELDLYIVLDEVRLDLATFSTLLKTIGQLGYGRDASIGLGRFELVGEPEKCTLSQPEANAYLTLANCAPQGLNLNAERSFYQITTRFGRHGDQAALSGNPFKKPIILAKPAALFTPEKYTSRLFLGNGLSEVSKVAPNAVHQGYAPVAAVYIDFTK